MLQYKKFSKGLKSTLNLSWEISLRRFGGGNRVSLDEMIFK